MPEKKPEKETPALSCEICLKEIDQSKAETYEVDEYVHHFCGLDCYSTWQHRTPPEESEKDQE